MKHYIVTFSSLEGAWRFQVAIGAERPEGAAAMGTEIMMRLFRDNVALPVSSVQVVEDPR